MAHAGAGRVHPAALPGDVLLAQCEQSARRRSGPGGQHRNKVETAVVLVHGPTGTTAQASERRSRRQNAAVALFRLRLQLALDVRTPPMPNAPSALWHARCRGGRIAVSTEHEDFPALIAEALDVVHALDCELPAAAAALGASATQLVRLLAKEPRALIAVNAARAARGRHPLRS
jgi:hypothetical protein